MRLDFVIIERGKEVGGTWFWNTYPGVGCDIPSHMYSFSWFLNPNWSRLFAPGAEIQQYLQESWIFAGLKPNTLLNARVTKAVFHSDKSKWTVSVEFSNKTIEDFEFDWLISCVGGLHYPLYPDIQNRESFNGKSWHTMKWNSNVSLKGKKVGMIGVGASAVQILPTLVAEAKKVVLFQRTAHYCLPRRQFTYSERRKTLLQFWPFTHLVRFFYYLRLELRWLLLFSPSIGNSGFTRRLFSSVSENYLTKCIKNKHLRAKLRPTFKIGCKRILISDEYYQCMNNENFTLDTSEILKFSENGIKTTEAEHDLDIVIYATGFSITKNLDWVRSHNRGMQDSWDTSYFGTFHKNAPNFCTFLGPMTALGHTSIIFMLECQIQVFCFTLV